MLRDLQKISFVNILDKGKQTMAMYDSLSIDQVMTKDVVTVEKGDIIINVATILSKNEFRALPVTSAEKLVEIVTTTDLVEYLIGQY
ncbi:MAG: CBS domain-containing protein [Lewinella sp.]|nr:CBS domain-containing protein [Lewinella sp.]